MIPLILTLILHAPLPLHTVPIGHTPRAVPQAMSYVQERARQRNPRRKGQR